MLSEDREAVRQSLDALRTCVVLDQDAKEALQGAQQGAVDHDWLLALVVGIHVLLHTATTGQHLPIAQSERVHVSLQHCRQNI